MNIISNFGEMSVESTAKIVLIMVLVVVGVIMIGYSMTGFEDVAGILESFFKESEKAEKDPTLETAIKCVYYRCKEGCESDIIDTLYTESFKCKDFCDPSKYKDEVFPWLSDDKICEQESADYPVVFFLSEHTMLTPVMGESDYITKPLYIVEDCGSVGRPWNAMWEFGSINIDDEIIEIDEAEEYCTKKENFQIGAGIETDSLYTNCLIEAGTYRLSFAPLHIPWSDVVEWNDIALCEK